MLRKKLKDNIKSSFLPADSVSMIANNLHITGNLDAEHDMRIDGRIDGDIHCRAKVVIGPSAMVKGSLHAENADIFGAVTGNIHTTGLLSLKSHCNINGDLSVGQLDIEPDAGFNGKCTMIQQGNAVSSVSANGLKLQEQN